MEQDKRHSGKLKKDELMSKFLEGTKLAIDRLIAQKIKEDGYLVVSRNGKPTKVRARDLRK